MRRYGRLRICFEGGIPTRGINGLSSCFLVISMISILDIHGLFLGAIKAFFIMSSTAPRTMVLRVRIPID